MKPSKTALLWLRNDLRLDDNAALTAAAKHHQVMIIYIVDDIAPKHFQYGAASRWWLHHALFDLNKQLQQQINFYRGDPNTIITQLCAKYDIHSVYWNRCYEPWAIERDTKIKQSLRKNNIQVHSSCASLLWEPWEILKKDNTPYKVFTLFYQRGCLSALPPHTPAPAPTKLSLKKDPLALSLDALQLQPKHIWVNKLENHWQPTKTVAEKQFITFLDESLNQYKLGRDKPANTAVSRLSPYIHFGQISINQVWHQVYSTPASDNRACFLKELGWREFSYYLLYHFPTLPTQSFNHRFDAFPWQVNQKYLSAWQQGQTGIPIVDAGMRELWQTGYMHNRVRMICASFLVKNLLIDWREGERWFWDCLVDADLASNLANWQWIAGCGADASPYFRVFNPVLQTQKFDAEGEYILKYVPELSGLPKKYLPCPFEAPAHVLERAGICLGKDYPQPIIDLKHSRERALSAYQKIKK